VTTACPVVRKSWARDNRRRRAIATMLQCAMRCARATTVFAENAFVFPPTPSPDPPCGRHMTIPQQQYNIIMMIIYVMIIRMVGLTAHMMNEKRPARISLKMHPTATDGLRRPTIARTGATLHATTPRRRVRRSTKGWMDGWEGTRSRARLNGLAGPRSWLFLFYRLLYHYIIS